MSAPAQHPAPKKASFSFCRLCREPAPTPLLSLKPTPIGGDYLSIDRAAATQPLLPLGLTGCSACGHVQLGHILDFETHYPERASFARVSAPPPEAARALARDLLRRFAVPAEGGVIVAGDPSLARAFLDEGRLVASIDPSHHGAMLGNAAGIPTYSSLQHDKFLDWCDRVGKTHLALVRDALARSPSPHAYLHMLHNLLRPGGALVLETPALEAIVERRLVGAVDHEHIDYYSLPGLARVLAENGFDLLEVELVPAQGGSWLGHAIRHPDGLPELRPSVRALIRDGDPARLTRAETYFPLRAALDRMRERLHAELAGLEGPARPVAGYGADAATTTLLYQLDLEPYLNFLIDDNPMLDGHFSPGCGLSVFGPEALSDWRRPEVVLIFSTRHAEAIVRRNEAYSRNGGRFLLLPDAGP